MTRAADLSGGPGRPAEEVTFNRDVARIIFRHCAPCHRPGEAGPFDLLSYDQVKKHGKQIVEVTRSGYMPPWPPEPGHGKFVGERRLTPGERDLLARWVSGGMPEGVAADLPPAPQWPQGWQIGPPDLVIEMPEAYRLPAEGADVYRNFVLLNPLPARRFVWAVEFRPESKAVHHVFVRVDATLQSRQLDAQSAEPGFPGLNVSAEMPEGQFLTCQPGKTISVAPPGMPWIFEPRVDLVLQMHLQPIGREALIRSRIGFYFTNRPPAQTPFKLALMSLQMAIPPGETNYLVTDSYTLPVDVQLFGILPHAHFLGTRFEAFAVLPDQSVTPLLLIKKWDFNWQGDYQYEAPLNLPKGTVVQMRYAYDNSAGNPRNPNHPPKLVRYGSQSSDEMAELWLQLLPVHAGDRTILAKDYNRKKFQVLADYAADFAREHPDDAQGRMKLGKVRLGQGRTAEASKEFAEAARLEPNSDEAHYFLGLVARMEGSFAAAEREFKRAIELNPAHAKAYGNLGWVLLEQGQAKEARASLARALELNPDDEIAREGLKSIEGKP